MARKMYFTAKGKDLVRELRVPEAERDLFERELRGIANACLGFHLGIRAIMRDEECENFSDLVRIVKKVNEETNEAENVNNIVVNEGKDFVDLRMGKSNEAKSDLTRPFLINECIVTLVEDKEAGEDEYFAKLDDKLTFTMNNKKGVPVTYSNYTIKDVLRTIEKLMGDGPKLADSWNGDNILCF